MNKFLARTFIVIVIAYGNVDPNVVIFFFWNNGLISQKKFLCARKV